jgi:hypothetical protein
MRQMRLEMAEQLKQQRKLAKQMVSTRKRAGGDSSWGSRGPLF